MNELILVLCWLGVVQSVLLGAYFLSSSKNKISYFFLGLMLLMIGIRVAKSTIYLFDQNPSLLIMNIGFGAHAMLGPLFLFYIQSITARNISRFYAFHFAPAVVVVFFSPYLTLDEFWYVGGYSALLYYTLVYLVLGWYLFIRNYDTEKMGKVILVLLITITIFQVSYFSNYILRLTPYEAGAILHSLLIYAITFLVLKNNNVFSQERKKKYDNLNLSKEEVDRYKQKLLDIMNQKQPFLDSGFSLARCSEMTGIPTYILSYVMSESFKQNFLTFVNSRRIEFAKRHLLDPTKQHLSIAGIAHDCGFNTLSSFNTAFKKFTGITPSDFRKKKAHEIL